MQCMMNNLFFIYLEGERQRTISETSSKGKKRKKGSPRDKEKGRKKRGESKTEGKCFVLVCLHGIEVHWATPFELHTPPVEDFSAA